MPIRSATSFGTGPWRALLFVQGTHGERSAQAMRNFGAIRWPVSCEPAIVDIDRDPLVARWYGIQTWPAVAIVHNAMLLAIEHTCTTDACARVLAAAQARAALVHRAL